MKRQILFHINEVDISLKLKYPYGSALPTKKRYPLACSLRDISFSLYIVSYKVLEGLAFYRYSVLAVLERYKGGAEKSVII